MVGSPRGLFGGLRAWHSAAADTDLDGRARVSDLYGARRGRVDCTVTLAHSRTKNLDQLISESEIVVPAIGVPNIINASNVKKDAILLDVGISSDGKGIHGDVDFAAVDGIAKAVTPMPGGTGPMTVACLLENTMKAAQLQGII